MAQQKDDSVYNSKLSALIKSAAKGDADAFGELLLIFERFVYNLALAFPFSEQDALDISQDVFLKAWRALPSFRFDSEFSTWIYRITKNTCLDYARKRKRYAAFSTTDSQEDNESIRAEIDIADSSTDPATTLERAQKIEAVRHELAKMPPSQREIIILRDIEGYSYRQISEILSLDIGTVKSRLNRARGKLKLSLQKWNLF